MKESKGRILARLPVFASPVPVWPGIRLDGLVQRPMVLSQRDLEQLPKRTLTQDFQCEEGWTVPAQRWEGPTIVDLIELAGVRPKARYLAISAGKFIVSLSLKEITQQVAILAMWLNGDALPQEHGGPCRLIVTDKSCYYSVKWVDRLRVLADPPEETGKEMALSRIKVQGALSPGG